MFLAILLFLTDVSSAQESPAEPASEAAPSEAARDRAVALFNNGKVLFDEGNYMAAVAAWERAYELTEEPKLLFNIASAYERAGEYAKALEALNLYRALGDIDDQETLQRRLRNLEAQIEREAETAELTLDPSAEPAGPSTPAAPRKRSAKVAGLALIGVGAAGLATGGVLAGLAGSASGRAQNDCLGGLCLKTAQQDIESARGLALGADIALISGAALLGTGTVLVVAGSGKRAASIRVGLNHATFSTHF